MTLSSPVQAALPFFRLLSHEPRRPMLLVFGSLVLASLSEGLGVSLLAPLLSILQDGVAPTTGLAADVGRIFALGNIPYHSISLLSFFLLLQALRIILQCYRELISNRLQFDLVDRLRERCFLAVLHSEWAYLSQRDNAQYANLLLTDINRIGIGVGFFMQLSSASALLLAYSLAAVCLSWKMTLLVLTMGLVFFFAENGLRREALALGSRIGQTSKNLHAAVQESLMGIKLVKILGNEQRHLHKFQHSMQAFRAQQLSFQRNSSYSKARMQLGSVVILVILLYTGLTVWQLPVAELASLIFIFSRLMPLGSQLQQQLHHWLHTLPAIANANHLLSECSVAAEPVANLRSLPALRMQQDITVDSLNFSYPGRERPALHAVKLRIIAKSTTAIIGSSGAGKSTLADVLMGLLRPDTGSICIDGQILDDAQRLHWRRSVAYVPQETILFNDSIRNNLLWAMPDADDAALWQALEKAAAGFVRQLPDGLDTVVGDQGLRLSGGERQRIALARALLGKPSLLILDEATSALDKENEERIRQAIVNLHGDLTVVAIGHRMATLQHADQVLVMEAGMIIEQGSWQQVQKN